MEQRSQLGLILAQNNSAMSDRVFGDPADAVNIGANDGRGTPDSGLDELPPVETTEQPISAGSSNVPKLDFTALTPSPRAVKHAMNSDILDIRMSDVVLTDAEAQTTGVTTSHKAVQTSTRREIHGPEAKPPTRQTGSRRGRRGCSGAKPLKAPNYLKLRDSNPELNITSRPFAAYGVGNAAANLRTGNAYEFNVKAQIRRISSLSHLANNRRKLHRQCCHQSACADPFQDQSAGKGKPRGVNLFEVSKDNPMVYN